MFDISSQALYRYPILWDAFSDLPDSFFLFADFIGFTNYTLNIEHFCHSFLTLAGFERA